MFSSRFHWDLRPNRLTQAVIEQRRSGATILDLTESNPTHAGLVYPSQIVEKFGDARMLVYEPAPAGLPSARAAVCAYYAARHREIDPSRILLTASTSEGYAYLFKLLCNPGDEVLVPRPSYPLFEFLATMESVEVRQYSLSYHGEWGIDFESLEAAVTSRTRAIVLVNPNNPTGSYVKQSEVDALVRIAADRGIALISDEVFADYSFATAPSINAPGSKGTNEPASQSASIGVPAEWQAKACPTMAGAFTCQADCLAFTMSGLSKISGLPQMKLGWIVASGPDALRTEALEKLEWIADTYLSVGAPVQYNAGRLLEAGQTIQDQIRARTAAHLVQARDTLAGSAANILHVEGGWYITLQVPRTRTEEEWALSLLESEKVLVQPGFFFDFESEAFLVVSLLTRPETFTDGLARIRRHLDKA